MTGKDIILFSTIDWNAYFWVNDQYDALQLAKRGYRIFYIDFLGMRKPRFTQYYITRVFDKIKQFFKFPKKVHENIWVWSPFRLPFLNNKVVNRVNIFLFDLMLGYFLHRLGFEYKTIWTYYPLTLLFISCNSTKKLIYFCEDELYSIPHMHVDLIKQFEKKLIKRANIVFTTSRNLFETRKVLNSNTYYFSNVVDYEHFNKAMNDSTNISQELLDISRPIIGYVGNICDFKMDFDLIYYLANVRPNWSFLLIGKVEELTVTKINSLKELSNVYFLGHRSYNDLPSYLKAFDVAILPCVHNEYTKNMFPMKFFEYLAAGKPVVSTKLHALEEFKNLFYEADSKEDFLHGLECALNGDVPPLEERLKAASLHTYESRMQKMLELIEECNC